MALDFLNAEAVYQTQSNITGPAFTMACWFTKDNTSAERHLMCLCDYDAIQLHTLGFGIASAGNDQLVAASYDGGGWFGSYVTSPTVTTGTWYHAAGRYNGTASRYSFLDGTNGGENTDSVTPSGIDRAIIGAQAYSSTIQNYHDGYIAHPCFWSTALSNNEIQALADGAHPLTISPADIVFYLPFTSTSGKELIQGTSWTVDSGIAYVADPVIAGAGANFVIAGVDAGASVAPLAGRHLQNMMGQ